MVTAELVAVLGQALDQINSQQAVTITVPLPTTVEDAWEIFSRVFIALSDVPEVAILFPLEQDMIEELGVTSLQMSDIRTALASLHHIEIPPAAEGEWPKTVMDFFQRYLVYTPVIANLVMKAISPDFAA